MNDRVELRPTSVPSSSAAGAVSEEESTDSVLPASKTPFQTCSQDGLVENTSFLPDVQDKSGNTSGLNSEKTEFITGN